MKVFLSADIEGTAGIAHWEETEHGKFLYDHFSRQMTREVAAACEGAIAAGADEILIKDAHDSARNIDPDALPECARIFRGWGREPYSMMAGLDKSFDGVVFTGYHSAAGTDFNPLSHTMNQGILAIRING
ncbi:MAG: M55 family metallopeptidase, partial [Clostridia bacterium]|nr:M55 family metallopeptidase [Clostridia bacterium]